jgi:uncharacterized protein (DUF1810 family)
MATMDDPFRLSRFVEAQAPVYEHALAELRRGCKTDHWMWFIFPQIEGLGYSMTARHYAIASLDEARAYLAHPVLGPRLLECTAAVNAHVDRTLRDIFGSPDDLKFRSCMTLFARAAPGEPSFQAALDAHAGGEHDPLTAERLSVDPGSPVV